MAHPYKYLDKNDSVKIAESFRNARRKLILLDYDGTLVPFRCEPARALPDRELMQLLHRLSSSENVSLVIISGRNRDFLQNNFVDLNATLFAEHGALYRINGMWDGIENDTSWKAEIMKFMKEISDITPGSEIEKKKNSLVWHYRKAESGHAENMATLLIEKINSYCLSNNLTIMKGKKIVEVKPSRYDKGTAILNNFNCDSFDFILAAGDDVTDEDLFRALPVSAIKISIGQSSSNADFTLKNSEELVSFLKGLASTQTF